MRSRWSEAKGHFFEKRVEKLFCCPATRRPRRERRKCGKGHFAKKSDPLTLEKENKSETREEGENKRKLNFVTHSPPTDANQTDSDPFFVCVKRSQSF